MRSTIDRQEKDGCEGTRGTPGILSSSMRNRQHRPGHVLLVMLYKRGLLPAQNTLRIKGRIIQTQVDQIFIKGTPALSIFPIHHGEKREPCVPDNRDTFVAQGTYRMDRFIHPARPDLGIS